MVFQRVVLVLVYAEMQMLIAFPISPNESST